MYVCVVDYIFFIKANVTMDVNANEVRDVKWVTPEELHAMFADPGKVGIMRGVGRRRRRRSRRRRKGVMETNSNVVNLEYRCSDDSLVQVDLQQLLVQLVGQD